jgi:hypothetical protein
MKDILYVGNTVGRTYQRRYRGLFERLEFGPKERITSTGKRYTGIVNGQKRLPPVWSR